VNFVLGGGKGGKGRGLDGLSDRRVIFDVMLEIGVNELDELDELDDVDEVDEEAEVATALDDE